MGNSQYSVNENDPLENLMIAKNIIEKAHSDVIMEMGKSDLLNQNIIELTNRINLSIATGQELKEQIIRLEDDKNNLLNQLTKITNENASLTQANNNLENSLNALNQDNNVLNDRVIMMTNRIKELEDHHINLIQNNQQAISNPPMSMPSNPVSLSSNLPMMQSNLVQQGSKSAHNFDKNLMLELKQKKESLLQNFPYFREGSKIEYENKGNWYHATVLKHIYSKKDKRMELVIQLENGKSSIIPYKNLGENVSSFRSA